MRVLYVLRYYETSPHRSSYSKGLSKKETVKNSMPIRMNYPRRKKWRAMSVGEEKKSICNGVSFVMLMSLSKCWYIVFLQNINVGDCNVLRIAKCSAIMLWVKIYNYLDKIKKLETSIFVKNWSRVISLYHFYYCYCFVAFFLILLTNRSRLRLNLYNETF